MTKTTTTMTLAALALAASQSPGVQADHVETALNTTQPQLSQTVNQDELATITHELASVDQERVEQEQVVAAAQAHYDETKEVTQLLDQDIHEAEALLAQATPAHVTDLEDAKQAVLEELENQDKQLIQLDTEKIQTQALLVGHEAEFLNRSEDYDKAMDQLKQVEGEVALAQGNLDGTGAEQVLEEVGTAESQLKQAKEGLETAQEKFLKAQQSDQEHQENLTKQALVVAQLEQDKSQVSASEEDARTHLEIRQVQVVEAESALTRARNDYQGINTISLSADYVRKLKAYAAGGFYSPESQEAEQQLKAMTSQLLAANQFKVNANDGDELLDPNQLDLATREHLTLFAVDLVNQIRHQMGTPAVHAHHKAVALAEGIADRYVMDDWNWNKSTRVNVHHTAAIQELAKDYGLKPSAHYENIHTVGTMYQPVTKLTLSQLKEEVYKAMIQFMFNGQEYFHAMSVGGVPGYGEASNYLGLAFSNRSDAFSIHLIGVNESAIDNHQLFNSQGTFTSEKTSSQIKETYRLAQGQYDQVQVDFQEAQSNYLAANLKFKSLSEQLNQANQLLAELRSEALQTPQAQLQLIQAEQDLDRAEARYRLAKKAEQDLTADVATKKDLLAKAMEKLAAAKEFLEGKNKDKQVAHDKLLAVQTEIEEKEEAISQAKTQQALLKEKLKSLETELEAVNQAPERLRLLKQRSLVIQSELTQATTTLRSEEDKLQDLIRRRQQLITQQAALQAALLKKEPKTPQASQLVKANSELNKVYSKVLPEPVSQVYGQSTTNSYLPQTGSKASHSFLYAGMMSLLTALGLRKKRRQ